MASEPSFATRLVAWQLAHGRHGLPWQVVIDPYRVWLSEIMLQQTQVSAVKAYFVRFLDRFPTVQALAQATEDDVLALWSGLGYYSRARNLYRCARMVCQDHAGQFPRTQQELQALPGIGPSTAAAIASICFHERVSIFDGNVQRVVARHAGFDHDLAQSAARHALKALADSCLPSPEQAHLMPTYTQGLMDLGATLCTPRSPQCARCPVATSCQALASARQLSLPVKTRKLRRQTRLVWWLVLRAQPNTFWLVKRPEVGIWASLHSFPEFDSEETARTAWVEGPLEAMPAFKHVLTHMDLVIHPLLVDGVDPSQLSGPGEGAWFSSSAGSAHVGMPKPVSRLLEQLQA